MEWESKMEWKHWQMNLTELKMNKVTMQKGSGDKRTNLRNCGKRCIDWILYGQGEKKLYISAVI